MNKDTIRIVNLHYNCKACKYRRHCMFWDGEDKAYNWEFCTADDFAEGVNATIKYLNKASSDTVARIISNNKSLKSWNKTT